MFDNDFKKFIGNYFWETKTSLLFDKYFYAYKILEFLFVILPLQGLIFFGLFVLENI